MSFQFWRIEFIVNTTGAGAQLRLHPSQWNDSTFAIAYQSTDPEDGSFGNARIRIFDAAGFPNGADFLLNTTTVGGVERVRSFSLADGRKLAIWLADEDGVSDQFGSTIRARFLGADGAPTGVDFALATGPSNTLTGNNLAQNQETRSVVLDDGGFLLTYARSNAADGSGSGYFAQRIDANGVTSGGEIALNGVTDGDQTFGGLIQLTAGEYVAAYDSRDAVSDGSG